MTVQLQRRHLGLAALALMLPIGAPAQTGRQHGNAGVWRVGPSRAVQSLREVSRLARDGDLIEVDAGEYRGDAAVWKQDRLRLRAVGGRVHLRADGVAAEDKGIWVIRGGRISVEGFDFTGARVPSRNGAGIRFEQGVLSIRDCSFIDNEMGLLTNNDATAELEIEDSEFAHNGRPDGHNHNLYVGRIARLRITGSYLHHGRTGHLLKSRAKLNHVLYNRLTDETGGHASYELEFPNGGIAYVIGNIVHQGLATENRHMLSFGAEGYVWPDNALYLVHNTLVDDLQWTGTWLRMREGERDVEVRAINNLLVSGAGGFDLSQGSRGNLHVRASDLVDLAAGDYRLKPQSRPPTTVSDPGEARGMSLRPNREYRHARRTIPLASPAVLAGALQGN